MNATDAERRDKFALEAMIHFLRTKTFDFNNYDGDALRLAWRSYYLADAMINASKLPPHSPEGSTCQAEQKREWVLPPDTSDVQRETTQPPSKKWSGLTDEDIAEVVGLPLEYVALEEFRKAEMYETILGEKNT